MLGIPIPPDPAASGVRERTLRPIKGGVGNGPECTVREARGEPEHPFVPFRRHERRPQSSRSAVRRPGGRDRHAACCSDRDGAVTWTGTRG